MVKIKSLIAIGCIVVLMAPSVAFAQSSDEGYGGAGGVAGQVETGGGDGGDEGGSPVTTSDSDSLPFTGAELGVLAAAGGMLVLLGFGLRRLTHGATRA
jgi:hypothetical protein